MSGLATWKIALVTLPLLGMSGMGIARRRNRSLFGGFLVGLCLGIGGLALLAMLPPGPPRTLSLSFTPRAWWKGGVLS